MLEAMSRRCSFRRSCFLEREGKLDYSYVMCGYCTLARPGLAFTEEQLAEDPEHCTCDWPVATVRVCTHIRITFESLRDAFQSGILPPNP
jgi:hypothetical protein